MINATEREERDYLEVIKEKLEHSINRVDQQTKEHAKELRQKKEYIHEHQSGMDEADHVAAGQSIDRIALSGESVVVRKRKLSKLLSTPYFGRIDFVARHRTTPIYVGIHTYTDDHSRHNLIYDWRAPVSSMFYDFELGEGWYETPAGKITGEIILKRQYRIRNGKMDFMIESGLNIQDDILQEELSRSSDAQMQNVVATIQREQNTVIRNESSGVMIIQGVAGSGKTTIALHRIAFLLYRFRKTLRAQDVLILSPNKVFADYISSVLPELGEEYIPEMVLEEFATAIFNNRFSFSGFYHQVSKLIDNKDEGFIERVKFKSSFEFLSKLNQYFVHIGNHYFKPRDIRVAGVVIPSDFVKERFAAYHRMPLFKRFPEVSRDIVARLRNEVNRKLSPRDRSLVESLVQQMFRINSIQSLYRDFYAWLGKPNLLQTAQDGKLEYADVFPLIYCLIRVEGLAPYDHVKHLVIDEMQDYTPVQYAVLSRLFNCNKTILGDVSQSVNPFGISSLEQIHQAFPQADTVTLLKSYRSTWEITRFAQRVIPNPAIEAMERHGEEPQILHCSSPEEEQNELRKQIQAFVTSNDKTMAILCKTSKQAERMYASLQGDNVHLLTSESQSFMTGVLITTAYLSKGLEFDRVVIPGVSSNHYMTSMDRSLLYIGCTRAMHQLTITYWGELSKLIS